MYTILSSASFWTSFEGPPGLLTISGSFGFPDMETSSLGHGKSSPGISASMSTSSLDETLVERANLLQSLLSESVTLDSLSSKSGDTLPSFPLRKLPTLSLIGLGDRLKLFSATLLPSKECTRNVQAKRRSVTIGAPTSPRLKNMLKECLSIKKWAESSTGWQAPGHVPWESVQESSARYWIPEGSYFSPEYFSLALRKARKRFGATQSFSLSATTPSRTDTSIVQSGSQETIATDFFDMMLELDTVKSFFQDIQDGIMFSKNSSNVETAGKLSVPSLVVSDSHFTFPIPLESSTSLSRLRPSVIAFRRGKTPPPPLVIGKHSPAFDIPYPNVPTAFLGQPSESSPVECIESDQRPTLHFEEMIKNLRLQCSTMELHNLPVDASWNSRTPTASPPPDPGESAVVLDKPRENIGKNRSLNAPAARKFDPLPVLRPRSVKPPAQTPLRLEAASPPRSKEHPPTLLPKPPPSRPLRSAMVKAIMSSTKPISKSVRFALTRHDLEKEISSSQLTTTVNTNTVSRPDAPAKTQTVVGRAPGAIHFPVSADRKLLQRSRSYIQRPSWKSLSQTKKSPQARSQSLIIGSTLPKSEVFNESGDDDNISVELFSSGRSTQSLGRHSLSRIIKGPIFSGRDVKRAAFSLGAHELDENDIRRETQSLSQSLQKKSRMPIPLRNILTRFK